MYGAWAVYVHTAMMYHSSLSTDQSSLCCTVFNGYHQPIGDILWQNIAVSDIGVYTVKSVDTGQNISEVWASKWVSSFLAAHQHILGYLVPYNDVEDTVKEIRYNQPVMWCGREEKLQSAVTHFSNFAPPEIVSVVCFRLVRTVALVSLDLHWRFVHGVIMTSI